MDDKTFKKAYNIAAEIIGMKTGATDEEISEAIKKVAILYPSIDQDALNKELHATYLTPVEEHQTLENGKPEPWLKQFRSDKKTTWDFWKRYSQYLKTEKRFAFAAIEQIDKLTEDVLDHLFDPQIRNIRIDKKGLVVGQVQSGKTANYTGLICKAADTGFNLIIVLAGIHNNLRSQTQNRLDEGFLGFDTYFVRRSDAGQRNKIGVGKFPGYQEAVAHSITTSDEKGDFTKKAADTLGINFETQTPILLVIKKNVSVMKRVLSWLQSISPDKKIDSKALLVIDDEADNASVNTKKKEEEPSSVNSHIRKIIDKFSRSAYVGYTATPFANIFIPQKDDDLFPRNFIINIPVPGSYIGPEKVFGTSVVPDENNDELLPIVNTIDDYTSFVPSGHKRDDPKPSFNDIPQSLKTAIKCFILTCSIRIARGQAKKHNSMLIHVTRYQNWQNEIKEIVEKFFRYYKTEIEAGDLGIYEEFRQVFEQDTPTYKSFVSVTDEILSSKFKNIDDRIRRHSWEEIKPRLYEAVQKIEVKSINGSSTDALTYYDNSENGISVIAIGGDKLSRGLTLEGLSVSYFLRASKMYDTLMQMGRWFGYRPGYVDLCRLFTSEELNDWFRHITLASEELRSEFNYLYELRETPDRYSLKVRTHPGSLQITSLSKRRYTTDVRVSWAGRLVETYQLPKDKSACKSNLFATEDFISRLKNPQTPESPSHKECTLWKNVSADEVCEYLCKFTVGKNLIKVNLDLICDYIHKLNESGELTSWSVALMSRVKCQEESRYIFSNGITVNCFLRNKADNTTKESYFIKKNHIVGNPEDEFIDLPDSILSAALERTKEVKSQHGKEWKKTYPAPEIVRNEFRDATNPLLMIYPLDAHGADESNKHTDDPIIGLVISFPNSSDKNMAISYTANLISEYAEDEENFYNENDNTYGNE
ncbi:MAG: Z1 domain-containing protein [Clostridium sp.]|nr:Z1 domain-containing protein [Bacteroides sp.]MCM1198203.1 Z1 domain-containing protein [Clostridium sp.]